MRDQVEFRCGGEAGVHRPEQPDASSAEEWAGYLFYRDNPRGELRERWVHSFGCGRWFTVRRDTVSHEMSEPETLATPQAADSSPGDEADPS